MSTSKNTRKFNNYRIKKRYIGLLYISPWLVGLILFQLYPLLISAYYSLCDYNVINAPKFIGFNNFIYMFTKDKLFWKSLFITIKYVLISVPCKLVFALSIALLLNSKLKGINFYRTVYYLPSIMGSSVAISFLWSYLFRPDGVVNTLIRKIGFKTVDFLGSPNIALYTISILAVWQFGSSMVLFLAQLKGISPTLYDSAKVDGAPRFTVFRKITLPMLSPIILFNLIMQMIGHLQEFTSAFVITKGGPAKSTYIYAFKIYDEGFKYFKMGYASALSWVLFLIIICFTVIIFKTSSWVYYEN